MPGKPKWPLDVYSTEELVRELFRRHEVFFMTGVKKAPLDTWPKLDKIRGTYARSGDIDAVKLIVACGIEILNAVDEQEEGDLYFE